MQDGSRLSDMNTVCSLFSLYSQFYICTSSPIVKKKWGVIWEIVGVPTLDVFTRLHVSLADMA